MPYVMTPRLSNTTARNPGGALPYQRLKMSPNLRGLTMPGEETFVNALIYQCSASETALYGNVFGGFSMLVRRQLLILPPPHSGGTPWFGAIRGTRLQRRRASLESSITGILKIGLNGTDQEVTKRVPLRRLADKPLRLCGIPL